MSFIANGVDEVRVVITNNNGKIKISGDSPLLPTILKRIAKRKQPILLSHSQYCAWFTYWKVFFKTTESQSVTPDTMIDVQIEKTDNVTIVTLSVARPIDGQIYDFCAIC